jgi:hypothetical protein
MGCKLGRYGWKTKERFQAGKRFLGLNSRKKVNRLQKLAFELIQGFLEFKSKGLNVFKSNLN